MTAHPVKRLILIAGGSGSGKTTLAMALAARFPSWGLLHLDDYLKTKDRVPKVDGYRNWDEPDAVDFPMLVQDLQALGRGKSISFLGYASHTERSDGRVLKTLAPSDTLILEGYLALWHPDIRRMAATSIYLDVPAHLRHSRRRWIMGADYLTKVLEPMHRLHIEPTKRHASLILDAGGLPPEEILEMAAAYLTSG